MPKNWPWKNKPKKKDEYDCPLPPRNSILVLCDCTVQVLFCFCPHCLLDKHAFLLGSGLCLCFKLKRLKTSELLTSVWPAWVQVGSLNHQLFTHFTMHTQMYSGASLSPCDDVPGRQWAQQTKVILCIVIKLFCFYLHLEFVYFVYFPKSIEIMLSQNIWDWIVTGICDTNMEILTSSRIVVANTDAFVWICPLASVCKILVLNSKWPLYALEENEELSLQVNIRICRIVFHFLI